MSDEIESVTLRLLRDMRAEMADMRAVLRLELGSLRADAASDLATLDAKIDAKRKDLRGQIVDRRRAVVEYHTSVIGHGALNSELEARRRRVEQHLNLSSDTH